MFKLTRQTFYYNSGSQCEPHELHRDFDALRRQKSGAVDKLKRGMTDGSEQD
ncbi:hypothetical protein [Sedimentitalea sp.]|uniref:hypothetical protein n=1 Tax=Sedimentitalea sp. TaxID=2048915 RepID=UPI00329A63EE